MKDEFEYEEVEKLNEELAKRERGLDKIDIDNVIEKIKKNKFHYRNELIANKLYNKALKDLKNKGK